MPASSRPADRGRRGTGWVVAQFALIAAVLAAGFVPPDWPGGVAGAFRVLSLALAIAGAAVAIAASRVLGPSLTPFPRPRPGGELVERGPYAVVRHPIYAAGLLFFTGYSLYAGVPAFALTCVLGVLWWFKSGVEERRLEGHFPGYADYRRRVPRRFVPGLL
jgi:protein-S-isoprenylcysteine O-methyltransferase Ste14